MKSLFIVSLLFIITSCGDSEMSEAERKEAQQMEKENINSMLHIAQALQEDAAAAEKEAEE